MGGTTRWMSPELFDANQSDPEGTRPTRQSDCYALGMVIYEVLSGQVPFASFHYCIAVRKIIEGERPRRPGGLEGMQFTDDLWRMLNQCWAAQPQRRPNVRDILECLGRVSVALEVDEDGGFYEEDRDWDTASDSTGMLSLLNPASFVAILRNILC